MGNANGRRGGGGGSKLLLGGFIGLVIGVLIAFGVVLYLNETPLPFVDKGGRSEPDQAADDKARAGAMPLPGKPGGKPQEKPRFEFYNILPGTQEPAPGKEAAAPGAEDSAPAPTELFYLQVGAFQKAADADNVKAKLALIGIEASVQDIAVPDKGVLHRVRTGPYATPNEMNQARTLMAQNGVQGTVIKIKDSGNPTPFLESKPASKP